MDQENIMKLPVRYSELYKRIKNGLSYYKNWEQWINSGNHEELGLGKHEAHILKCYMSLQGDIRAVCGRFNIPVNHIEQILSDIVKKIKLNYYNYQEWTALEDQPEIQFRENRSRDYNDFSIKEMIKNIYKNFPEVANEHLDKPLKEIDLKAFNLSGKLTSFLKAEGCNTINDLLHRYSNPVMVKELNKAPDKELINELRTFLNTVFG